ncbi:MAG TPA: type II toxin-antitoxin system RelE/ParE family toxin [Acidobacteriaceae bacterium]|nr:type II toxin-antitoxin system RelE/ParE family toxin [Acidobacteriaceae bacterium]
MTAFSCSPTHPHIGRARDEDLRPGIRSFPVGDYVILYRLEGRRIFVLRVLHGSRNLRALFGD